MTTALQVPVRAAKAVFREANDSASAKANPKKMSKALMDLVESLDGESIEDLEFSNKSKSLLEEIQGAMEDDRDVVVVDDDDDVEESTPMKKSKAKAPAKKTKTKVETKTAAKGKAAASAKKASKKSSSGGTSKYNPEYAVTRRQQAVAIRKEVSKGPKSIETIAKKTGLSESRITSHIKGHPAWYVVKKGQVHAKD